MTELCAQSQKQTFHVFLLVLSASKEFSRPHLHVVEDFEEGEGHTAADDHLIDLIQHVVNQLDLIFHLCSEKQTEASVSTRNGPSM